MNKDEWTADDILSGTLVRKIEKRFFDVDAAYTAKS